MTINVENKNDKNVLISFSCVCHIRLYTAEVLKQPYKAYCPIELNTHITKSLHCIFSHIIKAIDHKSISF